MRALLVSLVFVFCLPVLALAKNEALLQKIVLGATESESDSLILVQNGHIEFSSYFAGKDEVRSVQSVTKTLCALAIGVLLEKGKISSLDLPMSTWIPAWSSDKEKSKITLRMIMSHTSGLPDVDTVPDFWSKGDAVAAAATTPLISFPGSQYKYSSIGASLLQPVILQASGQSVSDFIRDVIFLPLRIDDFRWGRDKAGHEITSGGLFLSTADLLKIGLMLLQKGSFEGRVILSPGTLGELVKRSQPFTSYGLLFWLDQAHGTADSMLFSARGWDGQYVTVYPDKNLVAIRTKDPKSIVESKRDVQSFQDFRTLISLWE